MTDLLFLSNNDFFQLRWQYNAKQGKGRVNSFSFNDAFSKIAFCATGSTWTINLFVLQFVYNLLKVGRVAQSVRDRIPVGTRFSTRPDRP